MTFSLFGFAFLIFFGLTLGFGFFLSFFLGLTLGFKLALANLAWVVVGAAALCQGGDAAFGLNRLLG